MSDQQALFNDEALAREERDVFGDDLRPSQLRLDTEGDFIHGYVRGIERDVDLKTGFAPVDIITVEAIGGIHKGGAERLQVGRHYAFPLMHATAKNQVDAIDPEPSDGERIGIRRQRDFRSTQGVSTGKMLVGYLVKMPDRAALENPEATKGVQSQAEKVNEAAKGKVDPSKSSASADADNEVKHSSANKTAEPKAKADPAKV